MLQPCPLNKPAHLICVAFRYPECAVSQWIAWGSETLAPKQRNGAAKQRNGETTKRGNNETAKQRNEKQK